MPKSALAALLCRTGYPSGINDPCVSSLEFHLGQFERISKRLIRGHSTKDTVAFGPYVARSILEAGLIALRLRFDPFRSGSLHKLASHPKYDPNEVFKHRMQWVGDIYPSDTPPQDTWNPEQKVQDVSRALFAQHVIEMIWVPAAEALLDHLTKTGASVNIGFLQAYPPKIALARFHGEIRQLYSFLSKGVHGEFYLLSPSPLDPETCIEKLSTALELVAQLGLASHFAHRFALGIPPGHATKLYTRIRNMLDA